MPAPLTETRSGPLVRASGTFPSAEAADDALAAYLTEWHPLGATGRVAPTPTGYVVLCARAATPGAA